MSSAEVRRLLRSFCQADASFASTSMKPGRPHRDVGGKYVPPKNGLSSGVSHALSGQPPAPVVAWTNVM